MLHSRRSQSRTRHCALKVYYHDNFALQIPYMFNAPALVLVPNECDGAFFLLESICLPMPPTKSYFGPGDGVGCTNDP